MAAGYTAAMAEPVRQYPLAVALVARAAARLGLEIEILDPEFDYLFELRGPGFRRALLGGISPLNDKVVARIASDKHYTGLILERAGFRVPESMRCLSPGYFRQPDYQRRVGIEPGLAFAAERGYPVIVKPNRASKGRGVTAVDGPDELVRAVESVFEFDSVALVQPIVGLPDLRLDFLDGEYLLGYERLPRRVVGDGAKTLRQLIAASDERFRDEWRWQRVECGFELDAVPEAGRDIALSGPVLNLNGWAEARLIETIPDAWLRHSLAIGEALGMRHFGIDFRGASLEQDPSDVTIIEVNSSPALLRIGHLGWPEHAVAAQARVLEAIVSTPIPGSGGSGHDPAR